MFRNRFVKRFTALHARGHIAYDVAQTALAFRIALIVESSQTLNERNAGLDHGGELAGEKNQVGFFYFEDAFSSFTGHRFLLKRKHHEAAAHEAGDGVIFVECVLDTGDDATGGVSGLVGKGYHCYIFHNDWSSCSATPLINPSIPASSSR